VIDTRAFSETSLLVVGNINRDVKIAAIEPGPHLFADGETPTAGVRETVGGGGANSALAAAALGARRVTFAGKVGVDPLGERLARTLAARGVGAALVRDPGAATGTSVNLVWTTGHRHFVSCLPSAATLTFDEIDPGTLAGHDHLLRADPWFSEPMLFGGNRQLFERARGAGLAVSLDVNWDPQWGGAAAETIGRRKQALRDVLPLVDLAHGNVRELCAFADAADLAGALDRVTGWGARAVVVHMGERGAGYFAREGGLVVEPSVPAARVVNTTGTGDVLSVCMMLLHRRADVDVSAKLRLANAVVSEYVAGLRDLVPEVA
jgi:2-dehydro-3-deoxygluconokinase